MEEYMSNIVSMEDAEMPEMPKMRTLADTESEEVTGGFTPVPGLWYSPEPDTGKRISK
jgi:hypothetical protein